MTAASTTVPPRAYHGPALLRHGFRPFFLAAGLWAALAMVLWLAMLTGRIDLPTAFDPLSWHIHEMLFGFVAAAIAGFLLTAIPNWTGRLPVRGAPLAALALVWLAGRFAVGLSAWTGPVAAAFVDVAFLCLLGAVALREVVAGGNWRNLPVTAVIGILAVANLLMHLETIALTDLDGAGPRLAVATVAFLITMIGGRIVPSFTRNWLAKRGASKLPGGFGLLDKATLVVTAATGLIWTLIPDHPAVGAAALLAALLHAVRLARWRGLRTGAEPLVLVLHLGYVWLPVGFALIGFAIFWPGLGSSAALHALTAGAMGTMILAVMTRATLGHLGRPLNADSATSLIYLTVLLAAATRVFGPLAEGGGQAAFSISGLLWITAFVLFVVRFGPMLLGLRQSAD